MRVIKRSALAMTGAFEVAFAVAMAGTACASARRSESAVMIRVADDTVRLVRRQDAIGFSATAVIYNGTDQPLYRSLCGVAVQKLVAGRWETVWTPLCLGGGVPHAVSPHDSAVVTVPVFGSTLPNVVPAYDARMTPGQYRIVFSIGFGLRQQTIAEPLPVQKSASVPFALVQSG
jgi:hypothetical protein